MHWLCTGTHSEMAVQVAGATARVGLGGIWYQWMWLFSTPFYWLIAPITRRLRVTTTGDFFRIRYGKSLEMLYALVALFYFALVDRAFAARAPARPFPGRPAAPLRPKHLGHRAFGDVLNLRDGRRPGGGGLYRLPPGDLDHCAFALAGSGRAERRWGIYRAAREARPGVFCDHGPAQERQEGDPWFVVTMSILGLVGVVVQPHVMTATGSGKTETEARVGMVYGNFIKRLLTIAWAFTGLIAVAAFPEKLAGLDRTARRRGGRARRCSARRSSSSWAMAGGG